MVDLFDSIAHQFPIGTLVLWAAEPAPKSRSRIGPLRLPGEYSGQTWLVLDGQQRITTLVGVLLRDEEQWSDEGDDDPERWRLYFDARPDGGFTHHDPRSAEPPASYVEVSALMDTLKFFAQVNRILLAASHGSPGARSEQEAQEWVNRAQEVARAIQGYRIPIVEFTTNDLSIAVESFSRLNQRGRSITQDEMFSALTYEEEGGRPFHLAREIDDLQRDMIRSGFGGVDRTVLLRAVLTAAELDLYGANWTLLSEQLKTDVREALPRAVEEATTGLERARRFLDGLGVLNARMLPYSMQLVGLSAFFGRCPDPTPEQSDLLTKWFWTSSFTGWFGSGNPAQVRRLVEELRDEVARDPAPDSLRNMNLAQPALPTPLRFDLRSARSRALLCVLFGRSPLRPDGSPLEDGEAAGLLLQRGPESMRIVCPGVSDRRLRSSPANRILDVAPSHSPARSWLVELDPGVQAQVLESHALPADTVRLLEERDHETFLQRRMELLAEIEREFMRERGVVPSPDRTPAASPIDVDDDPPLAPPDH